MSTYACIYGTVRLDSAAAAALSRRVSQRWLTPPADGLRVTHDPDGGLTIAFDGDLVRNLGRHLFGDLSVAQRSGRVLGTLTIDTQDGGHVREVGVFSSTRAYYGAGECLAVPTPVQPAKRRVLFEGESRHGELAILVPYGSPEAGFEVVGPDPTYECACGGYDEADRACCVTYPRREEKVPGVTASEANRAP